MPRRLHLLRHAKSAWDDPLLTDHDRPLAPRGWHACDALTRHLDAAGLVPDLVLCSSAVRARQTLSGIRSALADDIEVEVEEDLYGAATSFLLERLRLVPDGITSTLLIGHNPGIAALASTLAGSGDDEALAGLRTRYPTGALASLSFDGSWADLERDGGHLDAFVTPRDLA